MTEEQYNQADDLQQVLYDWTGMLAENHPAITEAMERYLVVSSMPPDFYKWIRSQEWHFSPISFGEDIKYRWVSEAYSGQLTTKELYDLFTDINK